MSTRTCMWALILYNTEPEFCRTHNLCTCLDNLLPPCTLCMNGDWFELPWWSYQWMTQSQFTNNHQYEICHSTWENGPYRTKSKIFSRNSLHLQKSCESPEASPCDRAWRSKRATKIKNELLLFHKIIVNRNHIETITWPRREFSRNLIFNIARRFSSVQKLFVCNRSLWITLARNKLWRWGKDHFEAQ